MHARKIGTSLYRYTFRCLIPRFKKIKLVRFLDSNLDTLRSLIVNRISRAVLELDVFITFYNSIIALFVSVVSDRRSKYFRSLFSGSARKQKRGRFNRVKN